MKELWIIRDSGEGTYNMAVDELLLDLRRADKIKDVLRIYEWINKTVTIGYFQEIDKVVNLSEARKRGIKVIRRITGGGTVLHDKEITYSIILKKNPRINKTSIRDSYKYLSYPIVKSLRKIGINASFAGINDIVIEKSNKIKKISGNAQTRRGGCILQHGTLLLDVDKDEMFSVLKVSETKISDKKLKDIKERVTSIKEELKEKSKEFDKEKFIGLLIKNYKEEFNVITKEIDINKILSMYKDQVSS